MAQSPRKRFIADPADILLTTPGSLEAMMMSTRVPTRQLFAGLRVVIIDEIHAFADDDRGAHLSAVLERLARFCGRDVQRIGLSATVGNPDEILRWAAGSSKRAARVVSPGGSTNEARVSLDYVGSLENAAQMIKALHPGRKRLVFVDSRRTAEELGKLLNQREVLTFVTHGSLAATERRDAERAFHEGSDCVIVATSALELGIDVGDLDHVLQIDSPPTVASFLQRMGRTGRRADTAPNCTFLVTKDALVVQAAAILELHRQGYVEDAAPRRRAAHILAHQYMALAVQRGGVARADVAAWLDGATAFADLSREERELYAGGGANLLLARMLERELGDSAVSRNQSISFRDDAANSVVAVRQSIEALAREGRPSDEDARRFAIGASRGRVSKFQECLPEQLLLDLMARSVLDADGARRAVGTLVGKTG